MPKKSCGTIELIIGCMGSGKTMELLRRKNRAELAKRKCLLIKYYKDTRYSQEKIVTHNGITSEAIISLGNSLKDTIDNVENLKQYDCLFVDEIQFYPDGAETCDNLANVGFDIIVCGLQGDFQRHIFPTISKLIPLAEKIEQLTAIDPLCGNEASFTVRLTCEMDQEVIGGFNNYTTSCRQNLKHYNKSNT